MRVGRSSRSRALALLIAIGVALLSAPVAAEARTSVTLPGCTIAVTPDDGTVMVPRDTCSLGTRSDYGTGVTFTHYYDGAPPCTSTTNQVGCVRAIGVDSPDRGVNCSFQSYPAGQVGDGYDENVPATAGHAFSPPTEAGAAQVNAGGYTCQTAADAPTAAYGGTVSEPIRTAAADGSYQISYLANRRDTASAAFTDTASSQSRLTYGFDASGSFAYADSAAPTIRSYRWDFGDGTAPVTSSSSTIAHSFASGGTYTASLTVSDSFGTTDTISHVVNASTDGLSVQRAVVSEPTSGSVTVPVSVSLSPASSSTVTVDYATEDGTATAAHGDYVSAAGTLTFAPGQTAQTVALTVKASALNEDAGFAVVLSNASGAPIAAGRATVTITTESVISGTVADAAGHPFAGVAVRVAGDSASQTVTSDDAGRYSTQVPTGRYVVTATPDDGRYVPVAGTGCTVAGSGCSVTTSAKEPTTASFVGALAVSKISFEQQNVVTNDYGPVPDGGTYDGNWVRVNALVTNSGTRPLTTDGRFVRAAVPGSASTAPLTAARQGASTPVTIPPGGQATLRFVWDTNGQAWTTSAIADLDHEVRVVLTLTPSSSEQAMKVHPRPVILVHGWNSSAETWASYPGLMAATDPDWKAFAVGDGQAPGTVDTAPFRTSNSIFQNAEQEGRYIEGVREQHGAWHVDIVAHSMGGLISRQYIDSVMPAPGADDRPVVSHLVMLGTPNEGSPCAAAVVAALGARSTIADAQLGTSFARSFNIDVTDRRDVPFSILAGDALFTTCGTREHGDDVVSLSSALWTLDDRAVELGLQHTSMTFDPAAFELWVKPHLIGAGPQLPHYHASRSVSAQARIRAQAAPSSKRVCRVSVGGAPAFAATGSGTATPGGIRRTFTVTRARTMTLTMLTNGAGATLTTPKGRAAGQIAAGSAGAKGSSLQSFTVARPAPGRWTLTLRTSSGRSLVAYALAEAGSARSLSAKLTTGSARITAVTATVRGQAGAARVNALIVPASGHRRTVRLPAVHGHRGRYAARLSIPVRGATSTVQAIVRAQLGHQRLSAVTTAANACG